MKTIISSRHVAAPGFALGQSTAMSSRSKFMHIAHSYSLPCLILDRLNRHQVKNSYGGSALAKR